VVQAGVLKSLLNAWDLSQLAAAVASPVVAGFGHHGEQCALFIMLE
jgi:hypothetical protein